MKNLIKFLTLIFAFIFVCSFFACGNVSESSSNPSSDSSATDVEAEKCVDVFIFMGQSNMAGRGREYNEAIPCEEGHAYEYRAVTGSDQKGWLYPVIEPFGKDENNDALNDLYQGDGKKSGGMVSAFCESYYRKTGVPVVAISASVGGTSISLWTPGTSYFNECKRRLQSCLEYLKTADLGSVRHVSMVWCQGESDAGNFSKGIEYNPQLKSLVNGLKSSDGSRGIERCFIIPPSEYTDGELKSTKTAVVNEQLKLCREDDDFVLATLKFRNVPLKMRDDPHFHQGIYNVAGWDAGSRVADYITTGQTTECTPFVPGEEMELALEFNIFLTYYC